MSTIGIAHDLRYSMLLHKLAESNRITDTEARQAIASLSFYEHRSLCEAGIVPPSGQPVGQQPQMQKPATQIKQPSATAKDTWSGDGPVQTGMTVGVLGPDNLPVPYSVSRVDTSTNGVVVKDLQSGKEQSISIDDLQPFISSEQGTSVQQESTRLSRLQELAGIKEMGSSGATCAGAIAVAPTSTGKLHTRQTTEKLKKEYTRTTPAKTVIGDTKPNQNIGELSATLSANGKRSASRKGRT